MSFKSSNSRSVVSGLVLHYLPMSHKKDARLKRVNKGKPHDLAILDFSKTFDHVPYERLLRKLDHHGIRGKTLENY